MKTNLLNELRDYLMILFGTFLYAFSVVFFMLPYELTSGGVSGIGIILYYATGFEVQNTFAIINILLLIAALKVLGFKFMAKTIWAVGAITFWLWLVQRFAEMMYGELPMLCGEGQEFMACVIASLIEGIGIYFCFKSNGSTGGIDIIAAIINKYRNITLGTVMMLCDVAIISSCYFVFHDWQKCIFGYVMLVVASQTLDYLMNRNHQSVQFMVFSRNAENIANALIDTMHGVTVLDGTGWYTKTDRKVVLCVVRRREEVNVMRMIKVLDPYAFVTTANVHGVYGEGFDVMKTKVKMKPTIVFATNNEHKLSEVRAMLGDKFEVRSLKDIGCHMDLPETGDNLQANALQKAQFIKQFFGYDCFADDTGLEVTALNGEPGVFTARYGMIDEERRTGIKTDDTLSHDTELNMKVLLRNMEGKTDRSACFKTSIALIHNGKTISFEGRVDGEIALEKHGEHGFGYDPIFIPKGSQATFAELGDDIKNQISHRARAVQKLVEYLNGKA